MNRVLPGPTSNGDNPDLSHLNEEERNIIQSVLQRQRAEDQKERDLYSVRRKTEEARSADGYPVTGIAGGHNASRNPLGLLFAGGGNGAPAGASQHRQEQQRRLVGSGPAQPHQRCATTALTPAGAPVAAPTAAAGAASSSSSSSETCQLCLKTKFADGVGHICNYCNVRCCARCGGKVSLRSNKVIWVCIVCRSKQELLIRSGQWINQAPVGAPQQRPLCPAAGAAGVHHLYAGQISGAAAVATIPGAGAHAGLSSLLPQQHAESAAPLGSALMQRARSVEIPSAVPAAPFCSTGQTGSVPGIVTGLGGIGGLWRGRMGNSFNECDPHQQQNLVMLNQMQQAQQAQQQLMAPGMQTVPGPFGCPTQVTAYNRRGDFRRQLSAGNAEQGGCYYQQQQQAQQQHLSQVTQAQSQQNLSQPATQQAGVFGMPALLKNPTANLSTSFRNLLSRPFGKGQPQQQQQQIQLQQSGCVGGFSTNPIGMAPQTAVGIPGGMGSAGIIDPTIPAVLGSHPNITNPTGVGCLGGSQLGVTSVHRAKGGMLRNDSLSSDQSHTELHSYQHRRRHSRRLGKKKKRSSTAMSAATATGIRTSVSLYGRSSSDDELLHSDCSSCGDSVEDLDFDYGREEMSDAKIKKLLADPVSWKPSPSNPEVLIGHMLLKKLPSGLGSQTENAAQMLGLKIVGGKILRSTSRGSTSSSGSRRQLGAIIERVKKGSTADVVGHLKPGDQVLEWNGQSLRNKTYEEVFQIILASSQDLQVELIVSRSLTEPDALGEATADAAVAPLPGVETTPRGGSAREIRRHSSASAALTAGDVLLRKTFSTTYLPPVASAGGGSALLGGLLLSDATGGAGSGGGEVVAGRIQIKLWYDAAQLQLVVTVVGAADLPARLRASVPTHGRHTAPASSCLAAEPRNPYAKLFLLPDRSEKSKRRTKTIAGSNEPYWNQTFIYSALRRSDLMQRALEVTVWDYDRYGTNEFLGEALVDLANINIPFQDDINEEGDWHLLSMESSGGYNGGSSNALIAGSGVSAAGGLHSSPAGSAPGLRPAPRSSSAMLTTRRPMTSPSARWYSEGEELSEWEAASLEEFDCSMPPSMTMYLDSSGRQRVGSLDTLNVHSQPQQQPHQSELMARRRPSSYNRAGLLGGHRWDTSFMHQVPASRCAPPGGPPLVDHIHAIPGLGLQTGESANTAMLHPHGNRAAQQPTRTPINRGSVLHRGCSLEEDEYHYHQSGAFQASSGGSNLSLRSLSPTRDYRSGSPAFSLSHETLLAGQKRQLPPVPDGGFAAITGRHAMRDERVDTSLEASGRARLSAARIRRTSRAGPSTNVYASDSELGVQSSSSYYSERDQLEDYRRNHANHGRYRECSLDRWDQQRQRSDGSYYQADLQEGQARGHASHRGSHFSEKSHLVDRDRGSIQEECISSVADTGNHRGSIHKQFRASFQQDLEDETLGRESEGSYVRGEHSHSQSPLRQRDVTDATAARRPLHRDSRDYGIAISGHRHRDNSDGRYDYDYEQRGSFDRSLEREQHHMHQSRASSADHYSRQQQQQQQRQQRQSLSHSHNHPYEESPQRERAPRDREREQQRRSGNEHVSMRPHEPSRSDRGQSAYYSDRGLESDASETSSVISKLSSTTQSEALLHRGPLDRRQSSVQQQQRGSGSGGGQATSRTLSEFTHQKNQGGPVHPLSSSGRGSSNESSSMSMTMARSAADSRDATGYGSGGGHGTRESAGRLAPSAAGGSMSGGLMDRRSRDAHGRSGAESVEESARTSSQSVSETREGGSEEGSLSDTATANEDKHGGSSFEIAETSLYPSSAYASNPAGAANVAPAASASPATAAVSSSVSKSSQSQASALAAQQKSSKGARLGFRNRRKNKMGRGVHRSEEVAPDEVRHLVRQASSVSSDGEGSLSGDSATTWGASSVRGGAASSVASAGGGGPIGGFVEGLGPGQIVGRQALASPSLGDIQMSFCDKKGNLEVEVIRARGLQPPKVGSNVLPAPCVKVYLVRTAAGCSGSGAVGQQGLQAGPARRAGPGAGQLPASANSIVAKAKTTAARRTLDPLFQQQLIFHEDYRGCLLQVTVWGDYGGNAAGGGGGVRMRTDRKAFMGMAQIALDDLDLGRIVIGWYKLFHPTSLVNVVASQND